MQQYLYNQTDITFIYLPNCAWDWSESHNNPELTTVCIRIKYKFSYCPKYRYTIQCSSHHQTTSIIVRYNAHKPLWLKGRTWQAVLKQKNKCVNLCTVVVQDEFPHKTAATCDAATNKKTSQFQYIKNGCINIAILYSQTRLRWILL